MFTTIFQKTTNILKRSLSSNTTSVQTILQGSSKGEKITIQGWVKSLRKMKEAIFVDLSDGSCETKLQIIIPSSKRPQNLAVGSSIVANGLLTMSPKGAVELSANDIEVVGGCELDDGYPFAPRKSYAADYVRQYLHLRSRTNKFSSLLRVRDAATMSFNQHLHDNGYINIHTPILTSNDCEGAGEVFTICPDNKALLKQMSRENTKPEEEVYFNNKVFLTVSGQLHLESITHGISKTYCFGPTFRAENSRSRLHLSEFYMLEAEIAFINHLENLMSEIELLINNVTKCLLNKHEEDIKRCKEANAVEYCWLDKKFPVIQHDEAIKILKDNGHEGNFSKEEEMFLVKHCGNIPTFVINWPKDEKPFYMRECEDDSTKVAALDLLGPNVGEIVGGSLRENNYAKLEAKLPSKSLQWYLDLRKFGSVPTGGYGLGFERYLQMILGISNIKDVIPFPRWPHNCSL